MNDLVIIKRDQPVCDSLKVAEKFGKPHKSILRNIDNLMAQNCAVKSMFKSADYKSENGKVYRKFYMNRDGFSILAMGFTGKDALEWKVDYMNAFNTMERLLLEHQTPQWQQIREQSKSVRRAETDSIKRFVEYAQSSGSQNAYRYYGIFTTMVNKAIGVKRKEDMTTTQLSRLILVEDMITAVINQAIVSQMPYKEIYTLCKGKVEMFMSLAELSMIA